ncbi:hypothetical protein NA57DRAFT_54988 [Rhizodiscina lignyota]|uniref:Uncharacterized protein n=1 Tax=Rhizodiscina lignyota TaxID=1504668 RepID=A0A9P4M8C6_9PEZI|nr:hypothetical protein NA57DRAFT_54988 [Rhizodiscina lignyota]
MSGTVRTAQSNSSCSTYIMLSSCRKLRLPEARLVSGEAHFAHDANAESTSKKHQSGHSCRDRQLDAVAWVTCRLFTASLDFTSESSGGLFGWLIWSGWTDAQQQAQVETQALPRPATCTDYLVGCVLRCSARVTLTQQLLYQSAFHALCQFRRQSRNSTLVVGDAIEHITSSGSRGASSRANRRAAMPSSRAEATSVPPPPASNSDGFEGRYQPTHAHTTKLQTASSDLIAVSRCIASSKHVKTPTSCGKTARPASAQGREDVANATPTPGSLWSFSGNLVAQGQEQLINMRLHDSDGVTQTRERQQRHPFSSDAFMLHEPFLAAPTAASLQCCGYFAPHSGHSMPCCLCVLPLTCRPDNRRVL